MTPENLKHNIAITAYNLGYGAKKNFATYDLVEKAPGWIGFFSFAVGIFALVFPWLGLPFVSATLSVFGVAALYISFYTPNSPKYEQVGKTLTQMAHDLRSLYLTVTPTTDTQEILRIEAERKRIETEGNAVTVSKQIFLSDWAAHYKFFWQSQVSWIVEELKLTFWRDKVPLSFTVTLVLLGVGVVVAIGCWVLQTLVPCLASGATP